MNMQQIPKDAIGALSGLYYKIGRFDKAYYWNGEEWIKSDKHSAIVRSDISKKRDKFSLAQRVYTDTGLLYYDHEQGIEQAFNLEHSGFSPLLCVVSVILGESNGYKEIYI